MLFTHIGSIIELLNKEQVIVEMMQALIGSTAILLTIPLTVLVCGLLYVKLPQRSHVKEELPS